MAESTGIQWTDSTFNPWIGCTRISPGCEHCYAAVSTAARVLQVSWGVDAPRYRTSASTWQLPLRWQKGAAQFHARHGRRRRVFCASLADVFDNQVDPVWRTDLWKLVRATPLLDWLILTKRVGNVADMLPPDWGCGYGHVWLGVSVVNQAEAARDMPKLLALPAALRWLSLEPLLGPIDLGNPVGRFGERLDWVVVGGESGPLARPMAPAWVGDLRDQCTRLDLPFFFKQWGGAGKDKGGCQLGNQEAKAWPDAA